MRIKVVYRKLGKEKVYGWANSENNSIEIDERLKGKKQLEIILHEALHLLHPELEEDVRRRSGYRFPSQPGLRGGPHAVRPEDRSTSEDAQ